MKKVYHLKIDIYQHKKGIIKLASRVYYDLWTALKAIESLNDIFHQTIRKVELKVLEDDSE